MTEDNEHTAAPDMNPDEYYPEDEPDVPAHERFRRRIFKMVSVGVVDDIINQMYYTQYLQRYPCEICYGTGLYGSSHSGIFCCGLFSEDLHSKLPLPQTQRS